MKFEEYAKMAEMEEYYWWHVGKKFIIEECLKRINLGKGVKILNIGCGTGGTVAMLSKFGEIFNVDVSSEALAFAGARGAKNLIKVQGIELPFADNMFDVVIGLDIIEHIKDDGLALKEWYRVMRQGGVLLLTAPAYQWLWSEHDKSLHHYRRYSLNGFSRLCGQFLIFKKSYVIVFTLPLIISYRLFRKIVPASEGGASYVIVPPFVNNILILLLKFESKLLNYINFPFGSSILLVLKKREV